MVVGGGRGADGWRLCIGMRWWVSVRLLVAGDSALGMGWQAFVRFLMAADSAELS